MKLNDALRLIAGVMICISLLLQQFHSPLWIWFTVFIALNLIQSAFTKTQVEYCVCKILMLYFKG